jgi:hypothetical protein
LQQAVWIFSKELPQLGTMGKKGRLAQVLPVKMQQVEAIEEQPLRVMPDRQRLQ